MSILSEVETGKLMLLLTAWQTKTALRSVLRTAGMRSALTVAPLRTSYESSIRACSRHHVRRGDGLPAIGMGFERVLWASNEYFEPPLSSFGTDLYCKIHATALTSSPYS